MPILDILNQIKEKIVGTKTTKIDLSLDKATKDIISYKRNSSRNGYVDLVRSLISRTSDLKLNNMFFGGTLAGGLATFGQQGRLARYKTYESIVSNISYCFRALNVIVDNILAPDDITKQSLDINAIKQISDDVGTQGRIELARAFVDNLKIEKNLDVIIKNTLTHGDMFVEIAHSKDVLTSRAFLMESESEVTPLTEHTSIAFDEEEDTENKVIIESIFSDGVSNSFSGHDILRFSGKNSTFKIQLDYSSSLNEDQKNDTIDIKDIHLLYHEAKRVVKLQSDLYPVCFGYLIFPRYYIDPSLNVAEQTVNNVCLSILKSLEKRIPELKDFRDEKEIKYLIMNMIASSESHDKTMNIRFVPDNRMQHFKVPSTKFFPYGESIFDSTQFLSKVLIALETALAIQRINRSTEKRLIEVDIGLSRDAKKMIEELKEQFRKRKVSLDSFGSVDTIPSMISTFEDIYIPTKDGKKLVDVSTFTGGNVDTRSKSDELKFLRDSIIASLMVPPAFIGLEENATNRNMLSEENIVFARTIVNYQRFFTEQLESLLDKVLTLVNPEEAMSLLDNVSVTFPPPKSLQFEREARYMGELAALVQTLETIGIPREYSRKKYLTSIDWDEVEKVEVDEKIDKNLNITKPGEEAGMGGLGGMGGGFVPPSTPMTF